MSGAVVTVELPELPGKTFYVEALAAGDQPASVTAERSAALTLSPQEAARVAHGIPNAQVQIDGQSVKAEPALTPTAKPTAPLIQRRLALPARPAPITEYQAFGQYREPLQFAVRATLGQVSLLVLQLLSQTVLVLAVLLARSVAAVGRWCWRVLCGQHRLPEE